MFQAGEFDVCTLIYAEFRSAISQIVTPQQLIPFAPPKAKKQDGEEEVAAEGAQNGGLNGAISEYEPGEAEILTALMPTHISVQGVQALLAYEASERGAPMTAMDNATKIGQA